MAIVKKWLASGGLLGNVSGHSELECSMFKNVAPAAPEQALAALERAMLGLESGEAARELREYTELLRSIAYDPALFERCVELIVKIVAVDDINDRAHRTEIFTSLFQLHLSSTHGNAR